MHASTAAMLARYGRPMTLRRRVAGGSPTDAAVTGAGPRAVAPGEPVAGAVQCTAKATIGPALGAIAAPPVRGDLLLVDGRTLTVQACTPRVTGGAVAAYDLWLAG